MKKLLTGIVILALGLGSSVFYYINTHENDSANTEEKVYSEASFPAYTVNELKDDALLIIKGTPLEVEHEYMVNGDVPFTEFDFEVDNVLKGDQSIQSTAVKVLQDGNQYNEFIEHPLMELNEEFLLFLKESKDGNLIMVGGPSGKFQYNTDTEKYESTMGLVIDDITALD